MTVPWKASKGFMTALKFFWGNTKKCENRNLTQFLFQYIFLKCTGRYGLIDSYTLISLDSSITQYNNLVFPGGRVVLKPQKSVGWKSMVLKKSSTWLKTAKAAVIKRSMTFTWPMYRGKQNTMDVGLLSILQFLYNEMFICRTEYVSLHCVRR